MIHTLQRLWTPSPGLRTVSEGAGMQKWVSNWLWPVEDVEASACDCVWHDYYSVPRMCMQ